MAKITNLEAKTFQGKAQGFKVTLDDGRNGNLEEKQSDKGLRVGDEVTVTEIPYTSKAGNKSTLYGLRLGGSASSSQPQNSAPNSPPAPPSKPINTVNIAQMKFEARLKCLELANAGFLAGKLNDAEAKEHVVAWVAMADGLINEIFTK